jgi:hypothetical protein
MSGKAHSLTDQASTAGVPEGAQADSQAEAGEPERSAENPGGPPAHAGQPSSGQPGSGGRCYPPEEEQDGDDEYVPA